MQAEHSYPNKPSRTLDYIHTIYVDQLEKLLPLTEGLSLAEVHWETKEFASIYVHKIQGIIQANTVLMNLRDTYAVIVDNTSIKAYNVGNYPVDQFSLLDRIHYDALESKLERFSYLAYTCLGGDGLSDQMLIHVYDQHIKGRIDELYYPEISQNETI